MYALLDGNNFFVSCERVFDPSLLHIPVMVLSSNDGCVIARSNEVKDLGIPMGIPVFKIQKEIKKYNIQCKSSNFRLYRNMSERMMNSLLYFSDEIDVYSIDEAFIKISKKQDPNTFGETVSRQVSQWTGIPVSIGIAPTMTLAKIASKKSKREAGSCFVIDSDSDRIEFLKNMTIGEVWGIGTQSVLKLKQYGMTNAYEFAHAPDQWIQNIMGIGGLRIAYELRGSSCTRSETIINHKTLLSSQSFGNRITKIHDIEQSVASHVSDVAIRLRRQNSCAQHMKVFIQTPQHRTGSVQSISRWIHIPEPTQSTLTLTKIALDTLRKIYNPTLEYKKSGIVLSGLIPKNKTHSNTLFDQADVSTQESLMNSIDVINEKYGNMTIRTAAIGYDHSWSNKKRTISPEYTTDWGGIIRIGE